MPSRRPDGDATLSSPLERIAALETRTLGATVLWHPRHQRIGEQAVIAFSDDAWELSRIAPEFRRAGSDIGEALEDRGVSRRPVRFQRDDDDGLVLSFPDSRMHCEVDGEVVPPGTVDGEARVALDPARLERGVVLRLGSVLLCVGHVGLCPSPRGEGQLVGVGASIAKLRRAIAQAAATDMPVLILGETGVGKELVAQAIHTASARSHRTMVSVNMATLGESLAAADLFGAVKGAYTGAHGAREGFFAEADGGTLFLDEIGDTPAPVQPMLLRALETGEYRPLGAARALRADVRLIAATDRDLYARGFNQPLLRRLEAFVIPVPPLRARREDIGVLILHFLRRWREAEASLPPIPLPLVQALCLHDWPGNVRQLSHVVRRLLLTARDGDWPSPEALLRSIPDIGTSAETASAATVQRVETTSSPLPPSAPSPPSARRYRPPSQIGPDEVLAALDANQWCVRKAADALSVSRPSLYALLDAIPDIRRAEAIPFEEIEAVVREAPDDPNRWAAMLRTPRESLRRRVRALGLIAMR